MSAKEEANILSLFPELGIRVYDLEKDIRYDDKTAIREDEAALIYRGWLRRDPDTLEPDIAVAVKVFRAKTTERNLTEKNRIKDIRQEMWIMDQLKGHANVVDIVGAASEDWKLVVLMELAVDSVSSYLSSSKETVDWTTKAGFCSDAADGLDALHSLGFVHGDINGESIGVFRNSRASSGGGGRGGGRDLTAKIIDFGHCFAPGSEDKPDRDKDGDNDGNDGNDSNDSDSVKGPQQRFFAPECSTTTHGPSSLRVYARLPARDTYSFGLFVWLVVADGATPWAGLAPSEIEAVKHTDKGLRMLSDRLWEAPVPFRHVVAAACRYTPRDRIRLASVREIMSAVRALDSRALAPSSSDSSDSRLRVEQMKEEDLKAVHAVQLLAYREHPDWVEPVSVYRDFLTAYPAGCLVCKVRENKDETEGGESFTVAGYIISFPLEREAESVASFLSSHPLEVPITAQSFFIHDTSVHPDYHRRGVGTALYRAVWDHVLAKGFDELRIMCVRGLEGFWINACGFKAVDTTPTPSTTPTPLPHHRWAVNLVGFDTNWIIPMAKNNPNVKICDMPR